MGGGGRLDGGGAVGRGSCLNGVPRLREPKSGRGVVGVMGTRAHPHWDHIAEQLDFFHGAAGK